MKARWRIGLLWAAAALTAVGAEPRVWSGTVTNTTHDVTAPMTLELTISGETVTGWLVTAAPLQAGRWPVEGVRKGAWCDLTCRQTPETRTRFRGVFSATEFRGTYVVGGEGAVAQYGRFQVKAVAAR